MGRAAERRGRGEAHGRGLAVITSHIDGDRNVPNGLRKIRSIRGIQIIETKQCGIF